MVKLKLVLLTPWIGMKLSGIIVSEVSLRMISGDSGVDLVYTD